MLSGVRPEHRRVLGRLGVFKALASERHLFDHTPEAIAHARVHAKRIEHGPGKADDGSAGPTLDASSQPAVTGGPAA